MQNSTLVYFYTYNIPLKTGNGFVVRNYSNLRSYVKLGYKITGIYVTTESNPDTKNIDVHFPEVNCEMWRLCSNGHELLKSISYYKKNVVNRQNNYKVYGDSVKEYYFQKVTRKGVLDFISI